MSHPPYEVREVNAAPRAVAGVCTAPFQPVGAVVPLETPSGIAAMTTHHGDYGRIGDANAAILAWCKANNRQLAGPSWEVYGHWNADPAKLRTDIYYLLEGAGAAKGG